MRGAESRRARLRRFACATAIACLAATGFPAGAAHAQDLDFAMTPTSPDAEMLLEADYLIYDNDRNTITAEGSVQIDYDGHRLVARSITYDRNTSRLIAVGNVELVQPDGTRVYTEHIDVTDDFRDGFLRALRVETPDQVYFGAESAERRDGRVTTFNRGVYTACEPCEDNPDRPPVWRIKSQKIIWNGEEQTVRFEHPRLEMFGLPIAYAPFLVVPDPTVKRKTGMLMPSFHGSSELGVGMQVPYYFALSPTYDLTLYGTGYTRQGFLGQAEWRQQFNNGSYSVHVAGIRQRKPEAFLTIDNAAQRATRTSFERDRAMVGSKGHFNINPRWAFGWNALLQTDKNFSRTYSIPGYSDNAFHSQLYLTGLNDRNYFDLRAYRFTIQEPVRDFRRDDGTEIASARNLRQPWVLPILDYSMTPDEPVFGGELNVDVNIQGLHRNHLDTRGLIGQHTDQGTRSQVVRGVTGQTGRITTEAEWKRTIITQGGLAITPIGHLRGDAIHADLTQESVAAIGNMATDQISADIRSSYYRYMATAGMEARWPVLFSTTSSVHVLEPVGQIFARPDAQFQSRLGIPNEDAQSLVFDASNLFERDKFAGYDRIEGGVRANVGIRYSGSFNNGWSTNALFGQSYHLAGDNPFAAPDLVHVGAFSGLESSRSDYVGSVGVMSPLGLSLQAGGRFDKDNWNLRRADLTAGYVSPVFSVHGRYSNIAAQPGYGFANTREEVQVGASLNITEYWRVFGSTTFDLTRSDTFQAHPNPTLTFKSLGFAYEDECFTFLLSLAEGTNRRTGERSRTFAFAISLRTIGDFGSDSGSGVASSFAR